MDSFLLLRKEKETLYYVLLNQETLSEEQTIPFSQERLDSLLKNATGALLLEGTILLGKKLFLLEDLKEKGLKFWEDPRRTALGYGALSLFPGSDCIVLELEEGRCRFDAFEKTGNYLGGCELLHSYKTAHEELKTLSLDPEVRQATGSYFGLLGGIERILAEMAQESAARSSIKILATGALLKEERLLNDLLELIDVIQPSLLWIGLKEIAKEWIFKKQENL